VIAPVVEEEARDLVLAPLPAYVLVE